MICLTKLKETQSVTKRDNDLKSQNNKTSLSLMVNFTYSFIGSFPDLDIMLVQL